MKSNKSMTRNLFFALSGLCAGFSLNASAQAPTEAESEYCITWGFGHGGQYSYNAKCQQGLDETADYTAYRYYFLFLSKSLQDDAKAEISTKLKPRGLTLIGEANNGGIKFYTNKPGETVCFTYKYMGGSSDWNCFDPKPSLDTDPLAHESGAEILENNGFTKVADFVSQQVGTPSVEIFTK